MYRYVFFDLDGTLTDSKEGIVNSARHAIALLGGPALPEETLTRFVGPPLQGSFQEFCGYGESQTKEAIRIFRERYTAKGQFENRPTPGAAEMMAHLQARGVTMAIASSKIESMCRLICGRYGFAPYLTLIAGSPMDRDAVKAEVLRGAMEALGVVGEKRCQALMVGDRKYDVEGARACGIDCVGVEFFGYAAPGELEAAGACAVVNTVEALERFILTGNAGGGN